jgi:hypothetical protein
MIHIAHPMCLAMFPLLHSTHVNGYKFGDTQIEDELHSPQTCPHCKFYIITTHIKHEPYKKPKPNKEKENKMGGYEGILSMNHLKFMEFNDCTNFSYLGCCVRLMLSICAISCHLQPFHIHTLSGANEGLQVFVLFNACVGIMWDVPNAPQVNAQDLIHQKGLSRFRFSFYEQLKMIPFCMDLYANLNNHLLVIPLLNHMHIM